MPTIFVAVQCYQCSTMQVKQQKKSSNKWSCVVCNEKQSVRKVYAQAFMAKEVRKFVQNFNMSRQFEEDKQTPPEIEDHHQLLNNRSKKRTDWSEYIDPQDEKVTENDDEKGDEFEPKVMTELPNALFKKPKLKNYCGSSDGEKACKPVFGKRKNIKSSTSQALEPSGYHPTMVREVCDDYIMQKEDLFPGKESVKVQLTEGVSRWWLHGIQNDDDGSEIQEPTRRQPSNTKGACKWSEYVTVDDDGGGDAGCCLGLGSGRDLMDHSRNWNSDALELVSEDQRVEEDVHPDFL